MREIRISLEPSGGESGIRTHDRVSPIHAFQACAFNHSAISPFVSPCVECIGFVETDVAALWSSRTAFSVASPFTAFPITSDRIFRGE